MIPFFQWTHISIGPIVIQVWGLCVAVGMLVALLLIVWAAKKRELDTHIVTDAALWITLTSFLGARIVYVITEWNLFSGNTWEIVAVWHGGMSISGGFIGAVIAGVAFFRYKRVSFIEYADVFIFGLPIGLWIGRLGCFFIFDHPGSPTSFFLGQEYIDGSIRHNHGLYLSLSGFFLMLFFFFLWKYFKRLPHGMFIVIFALYEGVTRFFLDFFRATDIVSADTRFLGFTFAQYFAIALVVIGVYLWYTIHEKERSNT